jgi:O-6-methylguanine DNA methyltransferase
MPETIHYAWGESSLGPFLAATSANGLVALEFADDRARALEALHATVGEAQLAEDREGRIVPVARLREAIERPGSDPGVALDPRGSAYQKQVWSLLRDIPPGETTSYGALAARLGTRDAREVTEAIASNAIAILIPCHRVVKKDGSISGYKWGVRRKRALLERERSAAPFVLS